MKKIISKFLKNRDGATAIEYGLIAALIGVVIITAVTAIGDNLDTQFGNVADALTGDANGEKRGDGQ